MLKFLKKYSKLLALALIFSSLLPFLASAAEPQNTSKLTSTTQAQKRKREEDLTEKYDTSKLVGLFDFHYYPEEVRPRCGLPVQYNPCNRRVRYFYLLPDFSHNVIAIGKNCLKKHFGPTAKEAANTPENLRRRDIVRKILPHFISEKWYQKGNGNYVLNLTSLLEDTDLKEVIKCRDEHFTIFFHSEDTKKNPHPYDMAYNGTYANSCKAFEESYTLADKKFAAFCYFCKENEIF